MTHNERVLQLLSDGRPHSHHELYALHVIAHSRIADLRKRGHIIEAWREGDLYLYRLQDTGTAPLAPSSERSVPLSSHRAAVPVSLGPGRRSLGDTPSPAGAISSGAPYPSIPALVGTGAPDHLEAGVDGHPERNPGFTRETPQFLTGPRLDSLPTAVPSPQGSAPGPSPRRGASSLQLSFALDPWSRKVA